MSDVARFNPTGRFSGLADVYAKHRPDYPVAAVEHYPEVRLVWRCLARRCRLRDRHLDTPICGPRHPGDRRRAERRHAGAPKAEPGSFTIRYVKGPAEATGCRTAAQPRHWRRRHFTGSTRRKRFSEFHRLLRPGGWVALMWNERDERDPCTVAYGESCAPALTQQQWRRPGIVPVKYCCTRRCSSKRIAVVFHHEQSLDEEGLLGRAFSASYAPREPQAAEVFAARLREVFARYQREGAWCSVTKRRSISARARRVAEKDGNCYSTAYRFSSWWRVIACSESS